MCYSWSVYSETLGYWENVGKEGQQWHRDDNKLNLEKLENNLSNLAEKCFTVCILAYMSWLPVTVRECAGFLQHVCVLALIQYMCVVVMVSRSTGMCFTVLVMVSHSACVWWQFSQYMCVLIMFSHSMCVCWQVSQYVCILVIFSHSMCVCWQFCNRCLY